MVIPEYIIDLYNKNKKIIKKIENVEKINPKKDYSRKNFIYKKNNKIFKKSGKFKKKFKFYSKNRKNNFHNKKIANY